MRCAFCCAALNNQSPFVVVRHCIDGTQRHWCNNNHYQKWSEQNDTFKYAANPHRGMLGRPRKEGKENRDKYPYLDPDPGGATEAP